MTEPETQFDAQPLVDLYARMRRRSALLIVGALVTAVLLTVVTALVMTPLPPPDYSKVGVHLLLDDGRGQWDESLWANHLEYAAQITGANGIIVQVIRSDDLKTERWQTLLDLCAQYERTPVLRLAAAYDHDKKYWLSPVADADGGYRTLARQYADFLAGLDWHGQTPHVVLLNEPNNGGEWGGVPDPAAYARFVMDTIPVLRAAVPDVKILNGAIDLYAPNTGSTPFANGLHYIDANTFMDAMWQAQPEVFHQFDDWNSHSYPLGAFREPPWKQEFRLDAMHDAEIRGGRPPSGIFNRGVNGYAWELWKLSTYGINDLKVMITETGWRYAAGQPDSADTGEGYPSEEAAYTYLDLAMRGNDGGHHADSPESGWIPWLRDERVAAVAVFALNGVPWEWAHTNLLKMNEDGNIAGTTAMFDGLAGYQQP